MAALVPGDWYKFRFPATGPGGALAARCFDLPISAALSHTTGASSLLLNDMGLGISDDARIGRLVKIYGVQLLGWHYVPSTLTMGAGVSVANCTLILMWDRLWQGDASTVPALSTYMTISGGFGFLLPQYQGIVELLCVKSFSVRTSNGFQGDANLRVALDLSTDLDCVYGTPSGSINKIATGGLFLYAVGSGDIATNPPRTQGLVRLWYESR